MSLNTNRHLRLSTYAYPSLVWAVSPWHSWQQRNYNRVLSATIATHRCRSDVLDAIDAWYPLYAALVTTTDPECHVDSHALTLTSKFYFDDPGTIDSYADLRRAVEDGPHVESMPSESPAADRVFDLRDAFRDIQDELDRVALFRREEPAGPSVLLLDGEHPGPTDAWGYNVSLDALKPSLTDIWDERLGWYPKYQFEDAFKYLQWSVNENPGPVWVGRPTG